MSVDNFTFDDWHVVPSKNLLRKDGLKTRLEPKVMHLLICLARAEGELVARDELLDEIWPRVVVGDVLNNTIAMLRKALGDTHAPRRYIETIPKQGYRLIPAVSWPSGLPEKTAGDGDERGPAKTPSFIAENKIAILFIVSLLFVSVFYLKARQNTAAEPDFFVPEGLKTLAVLPFDTFSDKSDIRYFADGLVEELIHQLAANPEFRVIARTSTESFRNTNSDIKQISSILGARYIMEGSVRQSDETLRVTVQLNDAENGFHIWSRTFDHNQNDNLLDTQIKIGNKVTELISSNKPAAAIYQNRRHPNSAEAYKLFLIAQSHMKFTEVSHLEKALEYFQRSIEIAPDYALAYTGIAAAQLLLYQYKHNSLADTVRLSSQALDTALSIEPDLAEAYAVRGLQETYTLQFDAAEEDFKHAIELNPGLRFARHNYGFMLWSLLRSEEALEQFEIALEMDPLSSVTNFAIGDALTNLGEFDLATSHYLQCQELLPENYICFLGLATVFMLRGDFDQFSHYLDLASQRVESDNFWIATISALDALQNAEMTEARRFLDNASAQNPNNDYLLRTSLMLDLSLSSPGKFSRYIKQLIIENPNNSGLNLLLGLSSFYESNCSLAVSQYEQAIKENEYVMLDVWGFSIGVSHYLNLAYCYQELNRHKEAQESLKSYRNFIQSLPKAARTIPGIVYNEARYLVLTEKPDEAEALLGQIQDWPFIWLYDFDPVY